ncbi:hypothetical protein SeMB42_g06054 [Synchytrium endobioticum]|uniref:Uncharacterized protein n=1 Tax=Synchytrium endobioticum TaxID=286115 RepID=A0A507CKM9_9FUNG|nr:hypothetical protein SeMB42_g06054 [Synchytrium endobioticum]
MSKIHIALLVVLVFWASVSYSLPVGGESSGSADASRRRLNLDTIRATNIWAMSVTVEKSRLAAELGKLDKFISDRNPPVMCADVTRQMEVVQSILLGAAIPQMQSFPSPENLPGVGNRYATYKEIHSNYMRYTVAAEEKLAALQNVQEGASIAHIPLTPDEPDIRYEPDNGPPPASPYIFRSTQASTVLMDPRVETLSISFHDGSSLGSASASNTGVANGGSNLALGCIVAQPGSSSETCKWRSGVGMLGIMVSSGVHLFLLVVSRRHPSHDCTSSRHVHLRVQGRSGIVTAHGHNAIAMTNLTKRPASHPPLLSRDVTALWYKKTNDRLMDLHRLADDEEAHERELKAVLDAPGATAVAPGLVRDVIKDAQDSRDETEISDASHEDDDDGGPLSDDDNAM